MPCWDGCSDMGCGDAVWKRGRRKCEIRMRDGNVAANRMGRIAGCGVADACSNDIRAEGTWRPCGDRTSRFPDFPVTREAGSLSVNLGIRGTCVCCRYMPTLLLLLLLLLLRRACGCTSLLNEAMTRLVFHPCPSQPAIQIWSESASVSGCMRAINASQI